MNSIMTIEEKAKAYDEARARMSKAYNDNRCSLYFMKEIFPEPNKESEDERIRNTLIEYFNAYPKDYYGELKTSCIIAWLEKQSGVDNVSPKGSVNTVVTDSKRIKPNHRKPRFNEGDWVVLYDSATDIDKKAVQISRVKKTKSRVYEYWTKEGKWFGDGTTARLWDITKDANDGDILANKYGAIFINAGSSNRGGTLDCYCYLSVQNEFYIEEHKTGSWLYKDEIKPATKEQSDLLFQKMHEVGYKWNADKKELKKIEQNPAWSEDDEEKLNQLHKLIVKNAYEEYEIDTDDETLYGKWLKLDNWLKSLKERMKGE